MRTLSLLLVFPLILAAAPDKRGDRREDDQQQLAPLRDMVGTWRGVAQLQRGSTRGSWKESVQWQWSFPEGRAGLGFEIKGSKYFRSGMVQPAKQAGQIQMIVQPTDQEAQPWQFSGKLDAAGRLVLVNPAATSGTPARITLRLLAKGDRLTILLEQRIGTSFYSRLAEVGYTREGSDFGKGLNYPECIVSGGRGTTRVTYKGKTYYVCCSGCREAFEDDPERVLAEYQRRLKRKKSK
jgi:YHS domain-containing protein